MWLLTLSLALSSAFAVEEKASSHLSDFASTDAANDEASRSLLSAGLGMTLFVKSCDIDQTFAIDVPQDGTIRDIVYKIQEASESQRQSNVVWQGKIQRDLDVHLSDIGICPESTLICSGKSDIEALFEVFTDRDLTEQLFGYATYEAFETDYPTVEAQQEDLQGDWEMEELRLIVEFEGQRISRLTVRATSRKSQQSEIDWDAVGSLTELEIFELRWVLLVGESGTKSIVFSKLPRGLIELTVTRCLRKTAPFNFDGAPPALRNLDLSLNRQAGVLDFRGLEECKSLRTFTLRHNDYEDIANHLNLPSNILQLDLGVNRFDPAKEWNMKSLFRKVTPRANVVLR